MRFWMKFRGFLRGIFVNNAHNSPVCRDFLSGRGRRAPWSSPASRPDRPPPAPSHAAAAVAVPPLARFCVQKGTLFKAVHCVLPSASLILLPTTVLEYAPSPYLAYSASYLLLPFSFPFLIPLMCSWLPHFLLILLPHCCLPSFCFLPPSSHVLLTTSFPLCFPPLAFPPSASYLLHLMTPGVLTTSFPAYSASLVLPSLFLLPTSFLACAPDYILSRLFCFLTLAFSYSAVRPFLEYSPFYLLPRLSSFLLPASLILLPTLVFPHSASRHIPGICSFLSPIPLILLPSLCLSSFCFLPPSLMCSFLPPVPPYSASYLLLPFSVPFLIPLAFLPTFPTCMLPTSCFPYSVSKISKAASYSVWYPTP